MEYESIHYIIAILGGFVAGAINTLAGNGSAITLSILTELLGLPGNIANGTNRVGVLFQGMAASIGFHKHKKIPFQNARLIIVITSLGAIIGVVMATQLSNESFRIVFKFLMVIMLGVILVKPKRWLIESNPNVSIPLFVSIPLYFMIGFYGGFIQMGMGIFFLAILVLLAKYNIIEANAIKTLVVFLYTIIVLFIFHLYGLVNWQVGLIIAIGQTVGGYVTAHYASKYHSAELWAYRLLVLIVIIVLVQMFGIFGFFYKFF